MYRPALGAKPIGYAGDRAFACRGVVYDAALADEPRTNLELRFYQRDEPCASICELECRSEYKLETDETDIGYDRVQWFANLSARQIARIDTFQSENPPVGFERSVQLPVPYIHSVNAGRAAFEQHLGEAAGGGAKVEANPILRRQLEAVQGRDELQCAARDIAMRGLEFDARARSQQLRRLLDERSVGAHLSGFDRCAGLGARHRVAAFAKIPVCPRFCGMPDFTQHRRQSRAEALRAFSGGKCRFRTAECVQRCRYHAFRVEAGDFVHPFGRIVIDEAVGQHHWPEFEAGIEKAVPRQELHHMRAKTADRAFFYRDKHFMLTRKPAYQIPVERLGEAGVHDRGR